MKKAFLSLTVVAALILASCGGGGFEADAKKMANFRCEIEKLSTKAASGDEDAAKKMEKIQAEALEFAAKMQTKYKGKEKDKEMDEKYDKIEDEVMKKCEAESPKK